MRSENLAVMLTDIQGFTAATSRQTRAENARMLALHDALLLPVVRAFRGRRVKTIGDAWLVLFDGPSAAVLCGAAIQDRLWEYGRRVPEDRRIRVRVAVALGDVRVVRTGGAVDVFGEAVNLASRIEEAAPGGEVWVSEAVRLGMGADVALEEVGWREVKGMPEAVRLFRVARAAPPDGVAPGDAPPYGNAALGRVRRLAAPDPEALSRAADAEERGAARLGVLRRRAVPLAVALGLAAAGAGAWLSLRPPEAERLIAQGRLDDAKAAIDRRAIARGDLDPVVLYLRGRLEAARADAGEASRAGAYRYWARALAAGSGEALDALAVEARSPDCARRRSAAHALSDARVEAARPILERIAAAEPPPPDDEPPLETMKRLVGATDRCGDGDVARRGLEALDARKQR